MGVVGDFFSEKFKRFERRKLLKNSDSMELPITDHSLYPPTPEAQIKHTALYNSKKRSI
jgi:hypothetical protein